MNCCDKYDEELLKVLHELKCLKIEQKAGRTEIKMKRNASEQENDTRNVHSQSPCKKPHTYRAKYHVKPQFQSLTKKGRRVGAKKFSDQHYCNQYANKPTVNVDVQESYLMNCKQTVKFKPIK